MILIVTCSFDKTVDYIVNKLAKSYFRLNVDNFSDYIIDVSETNWTIKEGNITIKSQEVSAVYYRKPYLPNLNQYEMFYQEMISNDIIYLIKGMVASLDCIKLTCPFILQKAENKLFQMKVAQEVGFLMASTLLTNSKNSANEFVETDKCIIKPISTGKIVSDKKCEIYNTSIINSVDVDIELTPIFLQKYIKKDFEARVYFVKDRHCSVKIIANNKVDWRLDESKNDYEIISLPLEIRDKCLQFLKGLDIVFGAFDFIILNGNWYFLEVNPNGQWLWLEKHLNLSISKDIVAYLEEENMCKKEGIMKILSWIWKKIKLVFNFILELIIYISSISAVLSLSHDNTFCEIKGGLKSKETKKYKENLRFSLVNLFLGSYYLCILTFPIKSRKKEKFKLIKLLSIKEVIEKNHYTLLENDRSVKDIKNDDLSVKNELAKYELDRINRSINITQNKINSILSICLVIIPIMITYFATFFDSHFGSLSSCLKYHFAIGGGLLLYSIACLMIIFFTNYNREYIRRSKINLDKNVSYKDAIEIFRDEGDFETIHSLILTTRLLQIRRCIIIIGISLVTIIITILL